MLHVIIVFWEEVFIIVHVRDFNVLIIIFSEPTLHSPDKNPLKRFEKAQCD
jgi:hypothetical protein